MSVYTMGGYKDHVGCQQNHRMLPGEAENGVGMNRSVREGKTCKAL